MIPVVFGLAAFCSSSRAAPGARVAVGAGRAWDWVGAVVLDDRRPRRSSRPSAGNFSQSWSIATGHYRERMLDYGVWAAGALTIGLGVLPVVAALAGLVRPKDEPRTPPLRAFTALLGAAVLGFGLYTAVKASYLSTAFGDGDRRAQPHLPRRRSSSAAWRYGSSAHASSGFRSPSRPAPSPASSSARTTRCRTSRTRTPSASRSRRWRTGTSASPTTTCSGR